MEMKDLMEMWGIKNFMAKPAPELLTTIFSSLPYKDLKNAVLVSRWWRKVGENPSLWAKIKLEFGNWSLSEDRSLEVLSLKRVQSLEYVSLKSEKTFQIFKSSNSYGHQNWSP